MTLSRTQERKLKRSIKQIVGDDVRDLFVHPELFSTELLVEIYKKLGLLAVKARMEETKHEWAEKRRLILEPYLTRIGALNESQITGGQSPGPESASDVEREDQQPSEPSDE